MNNSTQESKLHYVAKALALLFVIVSHMPFGRGSAEIGRMAVGQIGIFVFFICSGFFFEETRLNKAFWIKKAKTIIAPWIIFATLTFIISTVISRSFRGFPLTYIKWICGVGSSYWYMSELLACYLLLQLILHDDKEKNDIILLLCGLISILSVILSACNVIKYNTSFNQYTNFLNWIGVFALGMLIRKRNWLNILVSKIVFWISLFSLLICVSMCIMRGVIIEAYIDLFSLPIDIFGSICVFYTANLLENNKLLVDIGKKSFFIYLIHIQLAGIINTRLPYSVFYFILRPIIALSISYLIAKAMEWTLLKLGVFDKVGILLALR